MVKGEEHLNIIKKLKSLLEEENNVSFAYLFGSFATGEAIANSDVDIAVYLKDDDMNNVLHLIYILSKNLGKEADLTVLNRTRNLFLLDTVFRDGIVLKDSPQREDFELRKEHEILDYKAFKRTLDAA